MIQQAFKFTNQAFDQFLKNRFGLDSTMVVNNRLVDPDGSVPLENQNKVVLSLVHVEQETVRAFNTRTQKLANGNFATLPPTQRYNLYLLVTSNFDKYDETLKFLNASIQFFQLYGALDAKTNSNIPKGLSRLEFELQKGGDYLEMHNLWSAIGAKYQPSVIYKMKLISVAADEVERFTTAISTTSNKALV